MTLSAGTQLLPGQHFLAAPSGASVNNPDQNFTAGIADNGGIALLNQLGTVIDQAGMCASTLYLEGDLLPPLASSSLDRSYERKPGGTFGSCIDTDNNLVDFTLISPSDPQNLSSPLTVCAVTVTKTPSPTTSATDTPTATATHTPSPTATATVTHTATATITDTPTQTATYTQTPTTTATDTPSATPTATLTATVTSTATLAPEQILISEFRTRGQNGASDEFIEIFNAGSGTVDIGGWLIKRSSGCGSSTATLVTVNAGTQLLPGQHFLAAPAGFSINDPDQNFTAGIADNGGIGLFNSYGIAVDRAGMCATTSYLDGNPLPPMSTSTLDRSYERIPDSCHDTNDNLADFTLIAPSNPQNLSSPLTACAETALTTSSNLSSTAAPGIIPGPILVKKSGYK